MNTIIRNIVAVVAGLLLGGAVNMGIIMISGSIIPPPEGADLKTVEGLQASMHLMQPKHFLLPFLAHALGAFTGALLTAFIAASYKIRLAVSIGIFFLVGGIQMVLLVPSPTWFTIVDLVGAYIPMAYLAGIVITNRNK